MVAKEVSLENQVHRDLRDHLDHVDNQACRDQVETEENLDLQVYLDSLDPADKLERAVREVQMALREKT